MDDDRKTNAQDITVVSLHWGSNYQWIPSQKFQHFAHDLMDLGVDIIHGHSSHHIQGIEIYKGKPIFYGLGDFIDDYAVDEVYRNDLGKLSKDRDVLEILFKSLLQYGDRISNTSIIQSLLTA
jgi:hypothetical protein